MEIGHVSPCVTQEKQNCDQNAFCHQSKALYSKINAFYPKVLTRKLYQNTANTFVATDLRNNDILTTQTVQYRVLKR
jgi:hypothetical protein